MRRSTRIAAVLALAACAHQHELVPAPGARTAEGRPRTAEETVEGVRIQVDSDAWKGRSVEDVLSPVLVQIQNGSARPLRITYGEFTLGGPSGFRLAALPPYRVLANDVAATAVPPGFMGQHFFLAPWSARYYLGMAPWPGPLPYDPLYYTRWYGAWPPNLPNEDVLRRALPEGVLDPNGAVSGFLYFANQPRGTQLTFLAALVDAQSGQSFGTISIPFLVK